MYVVLRIRFDHKEPSTRRGLIKLYGIIIILHFQFVENRMRRVALGKLLLLLLMLLRLLMMLLLLLLLLMLMMMMVMVMMLLLMLLLRLRRHVDLRLWERWCGSHCCGWLPIPARLRWLLLLVLRSLLPLDGRRWWRNWWLHLRRRWRRRRRRRGRLALSPRPDVHIMFTRHNWRWWHARFLLHPLRGRERRYRLCRLARHTRPCNLSRFLRLRLDLLCRTLLLRMLLILSW